jgi:hypothetical protein
LGNVISLKSLISPPHLHAFPGLNSKIKSKKTSHQHLEVPEKDGDYIVSPLVPHCIDADTLHLAFDVMLKTGVKISCKISLSLLNDYISLIRNSSSANLSFDPHPAIPNGKLQAPVPTPQ